MSSPIHHAKDLDAAVFYAPKWARDRTASPAPMSDAAAIRSHETSKRMSEANADDAMRELQRQLVRYRRESTARAPDGPILHAIAMRLGAVCGLIGLLAWGWITVPGIWRATRLMLPDALMVEFASGLGKYAGVLAQTLEPHGGSEQTTVSDLPPADATRSVPSLKPQAAPAPPNDGSVAQFSSDEIAAIITRGRSFLTMSDLASARLLFRRAAETHSAEGALALGATYDPAALKRMGVVGAAADLEQARWWYQRAAELGSTEAVQLLSHIRQ